MNVTNMKIGIVILASGTGSLTQAIINSVACGELDLEIIEVISDQPQAMVLERATKAGIRTFIHPMTSDRTEWDSELLLHIEALKPDLLVSVGFMRILSSRFVSRFKIINSHPALLPNFPGAHPVRDAIRAGVPITGATVHWVDSGIDTGKVIAQRQLDIIAGESENALHERIKIIEQGLIVETLKILLPTLESDHV